MRGETIIENFLGNQILVHPDLHMAALLSASLIIDEWKQGNENGKVR